MNYVEHRFALDVHETVSRESVCVKKGNTAHRLLIHLMEKGRPFHISPECYAVFTAKKPDGKVVFNDCTIEDCVIIYDFTPQTVAAAGLLESEIMLYGADDTLLTSSSFRIVVEDTVYDEEKELDSQTEATALTKLISEATTLITDVEGKLENGEFVGPQGPQGEQGEVDPEEIGRIVDKHLEKNPPAAYTLPIATETTLGGVKAAAATEEMTQPVGITAEGKLVTVPGQNSGGNADQGASWTTEQINLLDRLFNYIPWIDSGAGAIADSLIASLRGGSSGGEEPDTPVEPDEPNEPEVTLTSISAVYSGGDVAVGTALTYLTGIVVTAHYSDGTSKAVTGYTLSGTIAEGSNTITVSYEGKTATFTVTGVAESGGDAGETKTLTMTRNGTNPGASVWYNEDGTEYSLTKNGYFYKSNAVADADCEVTIKFTAEVTNADIVYYIGQIKREDRLAVYFAEQLGTASTEESVKTYTLHEGYELVIAVNNQSAVSTEVTCADGSFTDVTEFYTNLVGGYTLDAYLKSSDGSIAANWSQQNTSDLIDVSAVASVYIMTVASDGFTMQQFKLTYAFYDSSETFISGGNSPESTDEITPVAVPDGAKYMRVGGSRGNTKHGVYVGTNPAPYRYEFVAFA